MHQSTQGNNSAYLGPKIYDLLCDEVHQISRNTLSLQAKTINPRVNSNKICCLHPLN